MDSLPEGPKNLTQNSFSPPMMVTSCLLSILHGRRGGGEREGGKMGKGRKEERRMGRMEKKEREKKGGGGGGGGERGEWRGL